MLTSFWNKILWSTSAADSDFNYRFPQMSKNGKNSFTPLHKFQVDKEIV